MTRRVFTTRFTPRGAAAVLAIAALGSLALPACMTVTPPHPMSGDQASVKDWLMPSWPLRDIEWAQAIAPSLRGSVMAVHCGVVRDGSRLIPIETKCLRRIESYTLTDVGVIYQLAGLSAERTEPEDQETAGLLFVSRPLNNTGGGTSSNTPATPATSPIAGGHAKQPSEVQGTYIRVFSPLGEEFALDQHGPDANADAGIDSAVGVGGGTDEVNHAASSGPTGIVVHLEGLAGVEFEQPVIDALRKRGYLELRTPFPWSRWKPLTLELKTDDDVWHAASALGSMADDCLGEAAYAIEAAVLHLQRLHPELADKPLVLVGFSAGSLALPAVAARLGDRVNAAVLVGSGANIVHITQTSDLTNGGLNVLAFGKPATGAMAGLLSGAYLRRCTLDPYHAAALMRQYPVLQIHAASDDIVPASLGEDLYERLGRPERWTIPGGHRRLFLQMTPKADRIASWVLEAVKNPTKPMNGNGGSLLKPR